MLKFVLENYQYIIVFCLLGVTYIIAKIIGAKQNQRLNDEHSPMRQRAPSDIK